MSDDTENPTEVAPTQVNALNANEVGKPGIKTTEFWVAVAMLAAGAFLMSKQQYELGTALMAASGLGYKGARTYQKTKGL